MLASKLNERLVETVGDLDWYALRTSAQKEFVAQEILTGCGIVTFCPAEKLWRLSNGYAWKKERQSYALLARYVFVGLSPGTPVWLHLFRVPFIQSCVGINGVPLLIPSGKLAADGEPERGTMLHFISRFRNGLVHSDDEQFMKTHKEFKAGDLVRICEGPFDGMVVPVHKLKGEEAKIFFGLFGAMRELGIPTRRLERVA